MKKFYIIFLFLFAIVLNTIAQNRLERLYLEERQPSIFSDTRNQEQKEYAYEEAYKYGEYIKNPNSMDEKTAIYAGCHLIELHPYGPNVISLIISILKTMPMNIPLQQSYKFEGYTNSFQAIFFNNGKIFIPNFGDELLPKDINLSFSDKYLGYKARGLLYDPFGESGIGYLMKESDCKKDYFPDFFANYELRREDVQNDLDGNYVIGVGYLFNLQKVDAAKLYFDSFEKHPGSSLSRGNEDTNYKVSIKLCHTDIPFRTLYHSASDYENLKQAYSRLDEKAHRQWLAKKDREEDAKWQPYVKKYGAAAVKQARSYKVWIGMPVELARMNYGFVKRTQTFGSTVEILRGLGRTLWARNGRVFKIVTR